MIKRVDTALVPRVVEFQEHRTALITGNVPFEIRVAFSKLAHLLRLVELAVRPETERVLRTLTPRRRTNAKD